MAFLPDNCSTIEIIEKISTIIIAIFTIGFSIYIYKSQTNKDNKGLKLEWFKLIIIEHKFSLIFDFFNKVSLELEKLKNQEFNSNLEKRQELNEYILQQLSELDLNVISLLLSVDKMLYECVKEQFEQLTDKITKKLADENIDFSNNEIFREELSNTISNYRTQIIKMFVDFKGNNDSHKSYFPELFKKNKNKVITIL